MVSRSGEVGKADRGPRLCMTVLLIMTNFVSCGWELLELVWAQ